MHKSLELVISFFIAIVLIAALVFFCVMLVETKGMILILPAGIAILLYLTAYIHNNIFGTKC